MSLLQSIRRPRRLFSSTKSQPLAPLSAVQKVDNSWRIVSSDLEAVGIDFFTRVFLSTPDALDLFLKVLQMDDDELKSIKESHVSIIHFVRGNRMIKAHARLVIMEMGRCVAGLYDMKILGKYLLVDHLICILHLGCWVRKCMGDPLICDLHHSSMRQLNGLYSRVCCVWNYS